MPSDFLKRIAQIESSGGKNIKHKTIANPKSIHYGHTAAGSYALMPNTVYDILKSANPDQLVQLRKLIKANEQDIVQNAPQITNYLNTHPKDAEALAEINEKKLKEKFGDDEEKMALGWNRGLNVNISPDLLNKSDYVKKYRELKQTETKEPVFSKKIEPEKKFNYEDYISQRHSDLKKEFELD